MIPQDFQKYIRGKDFKDLLTRYEKASFSGLDTYFDEEDLLDIAEYYHIKGQADNAEGVTDYILRLFPDSVKAFLFKAKLALLSGDIELADKISLLIRDNTLPDAVYLRAEILVCKEMAAEAERLLDDYWEALPPEEFEEGSDSSVFRIFEDEEDTDEDMPIMRSEFALDVALMYCDHNDFEHSGKWLDRVHDMELQESTDYLEVKAILLTEKKMYREAITLWNKYIDNDAYSVRAWLHLSQCQYCSGECNEALQSIEYAEAIDASVHDIYIAKGNYLFSMGDYHAALAAYDSVKGYPDVALRCEILIASVYSGLEEYSNAYQHIIKAIEIFENDDAFSYYEDVQIEVYKNAALICSAVGNREKALEYAERLPLLGITDERYLFIKARIYLEAKDFNKGFGIISDILNANCHDNMTYIQLGCLLVDSGMVEHGYKMLHIAIESMEQKGSRADYGYEHLAFAALLTDKYDEFLAALEKSIATNPTDTYCMFSLLFPKYMPLAEYPEYARTHVIEYSRKKGG